MPLALPSGAIEMDTSSKSLMVSSNNPTSISKTNIATTRDAQLVLLSACGTRTSKTVRNTIVFTSSWHSPGLDLSQPDTK